MKLRKGVKWGQELSLQQLLVENESKSKGVG